MPSCVALLIAVAFSAATAAAQPVYSSGHYDWDDPRSWKDQQVPSNPDTLYVNHYITFTRDLVIQPPTVLVVGRYGTLCGQHKLDVACGASVLNYGRLYVQSATIRSGENHHVFHAKSQVTLLPCPVQPNSFIVVPPHGEMKVWPETLCKTEDTGYPSSVIAGEAESFSAATGLKAGDGQLWLSAPGPFSFTITDLCGRKLVKGSAVDSYSCNTDLLAPGVYVLKATTADQQQHSVKFTVTP